MIEEKKYRHFILTRFNIKLRYKNESKPFEQTEEWLNRRFELFEKYCYPSIRIQTNQNFTWLCLFDMDTPPEFKKRITDYSQIYSRFVPLFFSEEDASAEKQILVKEIKKRCDNADYILTTRVDNDDSLHCSMIDYIQRHIEFENKRKVYSFVYGYQYFEKMNFVFKMYYPNNHFLSMIEPNNENLMSIMAYKHTKARKSEDHVDIKTKPYWVEVVHGGNVNNQFMLLPKYRYQPILRHISFEEYGIKNEITKVGSILTFIVKVLPYVCAQAVVLLVNKIRRSMQ